MIIYIRVHTKSGEIIMLIRLLEVSVSCCLSTLLTVPTLPLSVLISLQSREVLVFVPPFRIESHRLLDSIYSYSMAHLCFCRVKLVSLLTSSLGNQQG